MERLKGGVGDYASDSEFKPDQLKAGVDVEMEHTGDADVSREIAKDHLTEDSEYYKKLELMESDIIVKALMNLIDKHPEKASYILAVARLLAKEDGE